MRSRKSLLRSSRVRLPSLRHPNTLDNSFSLSNKQKNPGTYPEIKFTYTSMNPQDMSIPPHVAIKSEYRQDENRKCIRREGREPDRKSC